VAVEELFAATSRSLVGRGDGTEQGKIMHSTGLKTAAGKFFAFVSQGELVVKLPAERVRALVESGEGRTFDAGKGRAMKEWVRLAPHDEAACIAYADEARRFVAGL
jgi:hypothetical protein